MLKSPGIALLSLWLCLPVSSFGAASSPAVGEVSAQESPPASPVVTTSSSVVSADAIELGRALLLQGRLDEARAVLLEVLRKDPDNAEAQRWFGQVALHQQRTAEGLEALERAVRLAPRDPDLRLELAAAYEQAGQPGEAERVYRDLLASNEQFVEAWYLLGQLSRSQGRLEQAIDAFERVVANPAAPVHHARVATEALNGLYPQWVDAWLADLDRAVRDRAATVEFGRLLMARNRFADAQRVFETLVSRSPDDGPPHYWLGRVLIIQRDFDQGFVHLERSVALAPANLRLKMDLGRSYEAAGRVDDARRVFTEVLAATRDEEFVGEARRRLALYDAAALVKAGDYAAALAIYRRLLAETPDDLRLRELIAPMLEELDLYAESDRNFEAMLARQPNDANLRMRLAVTYEQRGDSKRAQEFYAEVIALQPSGELATLALERLGLTEAAALLQQDRPAEALRIFERILKVAPQSPVALLGQAMALHRVGRNDEAEAVFQKVLTLTPDSEIVWLELGQFYVETGRTDDAIAAYERVERAATSEQQRRLTASLLNPQYARKLERLTADLERGKADIAAIVDFGATLVRRGLHQDAVKLLRQAVEDAPNDAQLHLWLGRAEIALGEVERGLAQVEHSARLAPGDPGPAYELAQVYERLNRYDEAERAWQEVIRRARDDVTLREDAEQGYGLLRARRRVQAEDLAGALAEMDKLVARFPAVERLRVGQGRLLLALNRDAEAEEVFAHLLAQDPENIALLLQLADTYREEARPQRAEQMYRAALEIDPENVGVHIALGRFFQGSGRDEEAFQALEQALALADGTAAEPQARAALNGLWNGVIERGRRELAAGSYDEAETSFLLLIEHRPDNPQARFFLSEVYRAKGDFARQAGTLAEVAAAPDANFVMKRRLALAYVHAGMLDEAATTLAEVIAAFPFDSEIRAALADIHQKRGEVGLARAEYLRLLELNPTIEWRVHALDRLGLEEVRAKRERREFEPALAELRRLIADVPEDSILFLELSHIQELAGRSADAEAAYREALRLAPGNADARLGLARIFAATGREAESIAIYSGLAVERPPTSLTDSARSELDALLMQRARDRIAAVEKQDAGEKVAALLPLGRETFDLASYDAASEIFQYLVRIAPDNAESHYWLGRIYIERKAFADSVVFMKRSVDLEPANPRYQHGLGRAYREMQLDRLAVQALEQAVSLAPDVVLSRFELADMYRRLGNEGGARTQYIEVLERATDQPSIDRALNGLGLNENPDRLDRSGLEAALRLFEGSVSATPRSSQVRLYPAIVYHRLKRYTEAEAIYREVLASGSGQLQAALRLARLLGETDRVDEEITLLDLIAERGGDPQLIATARQRQTELYVGKAVKLTEELNQGKGDLVEARNLGRILVERNAHDQAVPMLEAATRRSPRDPQLWYFLGRAHADRGRFGPGLAALERSAELFPTSLLLRYHLALAYQRAGRIDDAVPIYETLTRQNEDAQIQFQARMSLGMIRGARLAGAGDYAGALREYDALLTLAPDDVSLLSERGRMLLQLGRDDEADATFERILALAPDNLAVRLRLAEIYRVRGDNVRYLEQLAAIIRISPRSAESRQARTLLGFDSAMELLASGQIEDAGEALERITMVVPEDPLIRYEYGQVLLQQRRFAEAEAQLTEATRLLPDYQDAHLALGRLYEGLERPDSAIRSYERVLELGRNTEAGREAQPQLAALYGARLQELLSEGREDEAMAGLLKLIETDPGNTAARTTLASMYTRAKRYDDALRELEMALRYQPGNPVIYAQMGINYTATARDQFAVDAFAYAISLDTNQERIEEMVRELILAVARNMVVEDRPFAAIRHLKGINDQGLGNERTYYMLAAIYRQQNRFDEATRAFRDAVRFAPDNIGMRFNLAELYERNNDLDLALIQYRQIVRTGRPGEDIVEESRRRASLLRTRTALFTSQLSYNVTVGESTIEEQDLNGTGALNSNFSSQLFYNLSTNFRPTSYLNLWMDTGLIYITNHSTELDTLVARLGVAGNLNFPTHFYGATLHATDNRELITDTYQGSSYAATVSGGFRFTDYRDLLPAGWGRKRLEERGEPVIEQAPETRIAVDLEADNPRLRRALEIAARRQNLASAPAAGEVVRRHQVKAGESIADIAAALGFDVVRWQEQGRDNPRIVDPALILPGDTVVLTGGDDDPMIIIESTADGARLAMQLEALTPEQRLDREFRIRASVDQGMAAYRDGLAAVRQGRFGDARPRLEQVLVTVSDDPLTLLNLGVIERNQGRNGAAEQAWRKALSVDPNLQAARLGLAELYTDTQDFPAAVAMIEQLVAMRNPLTPLNEASVLAQRIADTLIADAVSARPASPDEVPGLLHRLADSLVALDDPAAARRVLESMLEHWPSDAEANFLLAGVLMTMNQAPLAIVPAERSVEIAPGQLRYHLRLARVLRDAGEHVRAEESYERVLDLAADEATVATARLEAGMTRAARLEATGETGAALEVYTELLDEHPDDVPLLLREADAAATLGRLDQAAELVQRAIAIEPRRFDLRLRLADLYRGNDRAQAANEALTAALGLAEDSAQRREVLDRLGFEDALEQIRRGRWSRAMSIMERIQAVAPDEPLVQLNIGVIRQHQQRYPEAEAAFQQVLDKDSRNLTARLRLGLLYSETNRIDRAITLLEQVASEGSGQGAGTRAREALEDLEQRRLRTLSGDVIARSSPTMKTVQLRGFYNDSSLPSRSLTESFSYGVGLTLYFRSLRFGDWQLNYTFGTRENEDPLGTDYAYVWNEFGVNWRASVPNPWNLFGSSPNIPGLTGTVSLTREMRAYTFADTNALNALGVAHRRQQDSDTLSLGLNFQPPNHDQISFFLTYTLGQLRADLPVGIVFSPDGIPIAFQSSGLGDFEPNYITTGMAFQF